jgi:hypothetical protein
MAELTEKFCNISDDSARKKHKKRSGRVGLAELVLAELSGNLLPMAISMIWLFYSSTTPLLFFLQPPFVLENCDKTARGSDLSVNCVFYYFSTSYFILLLPLLAVCKHDVLAVNKQTFNRSCPLAVW